MVLSRRVLVQSPIIGKGLHGWDLLLHVWSYWELFLGSVLELYITAHLTPFLIGFVVLQGVVSCWGDDYFVRVGFRDKRRSKVRFLHHNIELFLNYFIFIKITFGAHVPFEGLLDRTVQLDRWRSAPMGSSLACHRARQTKICHPGGVAGS